MRSSSGDLDDARHGLRGSGGGEVLRPDDSLARALRMALAHLDDLAYLRKHPLAALLSGGRGALPAHSVRGSLVRQRLLDAIELLRPSHATPENTSAWRSYRLLTLRYVEGRDGQAVQDRLGLAKSQYYVELTRALERLADLFAEHWLGHGADLSTSPASRSPARSAGAGTGAAPTAQPGAFAPQAVARLPSPLTSFVGREREVAALTAMLSGQGPDGVQSRRHRLVTITGPAGAGKTRLSLQVAEELREAYGDRVIFVPLASLEDPGLVLPTVCRALGLADDGTLPLTARLASALQDHETLLVLDNVEQVRGAAPAIAELLGSCRPLTVLAASRAPLQLYGELEFPLGPLAVPDEDAARRIDALRANPAVRLFVDRAQLVRPAFALTERNAAAVAEVCCRLDGLPLAIELAASRIKLLSPEGLVERLDRRLAALNAGPSDLPARQRSLRGALEWSYNLLAPPEQALFRQLSVFAPGWTLGAAQAVAGAGATLDTLGSLVNQSLVVREDDQGGDARFSMLYTIREYGRDLLDERHELEPARERHAAYYTRLALDAEPRLYGPDQVAWVALLERERENLRATLRWCLESGHVEQGLRVAAALAILWRRRAEFTEGRIWLRELLESPAGVAPTAARELAALWAGILAVYQSDWSQAQAWYEESLSIARERGDRVGIARALTSLGYAAYFQGDEVSAERYAQEARAAYGELDDREHSPNALDLLGHVAAARGSHGEARAHYERALAIRQEVGDVASVGWSYHQLGSLALDEGDLDTARSWLERSMAIRRRVDDGGGAVLTLQAFARLLVAEGRPRRALQVAAAAAERAQAFGMPPRPADHAKLERSLALARRQLGADAARAAWDEGRAMTMDEAMAAAVA